MDWLINAVNAILMSPTQVFLLFWLPLIVCSVSYTALTIKQTKQDAVKRAKAEAVEASGQKLTHYDEYEPTVTVGTILGRIFISLCPGVNLVNAVFIQSWRLVRNVVETFHDVFNQPLVPKRKL